MTYDWYKTFIICLPPLFRVAGCGTVSGRKGGTQDNTHNRELILKNHFGNCRVDRGTGNRSSCRLMIRAKMSQRAHCKICFGCRCRLCGRVCISFPVIRNCNGWFRHHPLNVITTEATTKQLMWNSKKCSRFKSHLQV